MRISGVYAIVNGENEKCYIGSSIDVVQRWGQHRSDLRNGKGHAIALQRAWNKYGETVFSFIVLEKVDDPTQLSAREQYYLDTYKPEYNILSIAYSVSGYTHTKEQLEARRANHKLAMQRPEVRKKISESQRKRVTTEAIRERMSLAQRIAQNRPEVKERQRQVQTGKKMPREAVERAREKRTGQKRTIEQRERMSQSRLQWYAEQKRLKESNQIQEGGT